MLLTKFYIGLIGQMLFGNGMSLRMFVKSIWSSNNHVIWSNIESAKFDYLQLKICSNTFAP